MITLSIYVPIKGFVFSLSSTCTCSLIFFLKYNLSTRATFVSTVLLSFVLYKQNFPFWNSGLKMYSTLLNNSLH